MQISQNENSRANPNKVTLCSNHAAVNRVKNNLFAQPYLLSCPLNTSSVGTPPGSPDSVSLVTRPCDKANNNLRIVHNNLKDNETRETFGVCVKGIDFLGDFSVRLVEWIELLKALGVHRIFTYQLQVHKNVSKVSFLF